MLLPSAINYIKRAAIGTNLESAQVVKHARNLASVKAELKQLEADRAQLLQEDEVHR